MKDELLDRFGNIPKSVDNLLRIALIRVRAHAMYITEIKGKNERILFTFRPDAPIDPTGIPAFLKSHKDRLFFTSYGSPFFTWKYEKTGLVEKMRSCFSGTPKNCLPRWKKSSASAD